MSDAVDLRDRVEQLSVALTALDGGAQVKRLAAFRALSALPPAQAASLLDAWLGRVLEGAPAPRAALPAALGALEVGGDEAGGFARALEEAAHQADLVAVASFFSKEPARLEYDRGAAMKADARQFSDSLGHLKTQARLGRNLERLARLATLSQGTVIRNLLLNPHTTEPLVVRIAARRPVRPEPLLEVWRHDKWGTRLAVRQALVRNPYLPPAFGARLLPLLTRVDWGALADDGAVHPTVRTVAQHFFAGRTRADSGLAGERER